MELSALLRKTAKGIAEVNTRKNRIPSRARTLLIRVDGRQTVNQLLGQEASGSAAEYHLEWLLEESYIESVTTSDSSPFTAANPIDLAPVKRYLDRTLHEYLGPETDAFGTKIDRLRSVEECQALLKSVAEVLTAVAGARKTGHFMEQITRNLPGEIFSPQPALPPD